MEKILRWDLAKCDDGTVMHRGRHGDETLAQGAAGKGQGSAKFLAKKRRPEFPDGGLSLGALAQ